MSTSLSRTAVLLPALLLVVSACATKGWVNETLAKRDAQLGQRIDTTDQQVTGVGQRVDQVEGKVARESQRLDAVDTRVTTVGTTVTEESDAARGAKEASNAAMAKAEGVDQRVTRL